MEAQLQYYIGRNKFDKKLKAFLKDDYPALFPAAKTAIQHVKAGLLNEKIKLPTGRPRMAFEIIARYHLDTFLEEEDVDDGGAL